MCRWIYLTATNGWSSFKWFHLWDVTWKNGLDFDDIGIVISDFDNDFLVVSTVFSIGSVLHGIYGGLTVGCKVDVKLWHESMFCQK